MSPAARRIVYGLVSHILEEMRELMAREIKTRAEEEATAHQVTCDL